MKNNTIIVLLIINFFSCGNNTKDTQKTIEKAAKSIEKAQNQTELDTTAILKEKISIHYQSTSKKYRSETIQLGEYKFIVYGGFYNLDLNKSYLSTYIDSIKVIEPFYSIIENDGIGGYLQKSKGYSFADIIRLNDTNNDGMKDIEVYNHLSSGNGSNSTFDVFLKFESHFEYSPEFSLANLEYDSKTNTYTSRYNGGHAGKIYKITTYNHNGKSLTPITTETQDYDYEKKIYLRTTRDIKSNIINTEVIEYNK